jgi:hypothetical protein
LLENIKCLETQLKRIQIKYLLTIKYLLGLTDQNVSQIILQAYKNTRNEETKNLIEALDKEIKTYSSSVKKMSEE